MNNALTTTPEKIERITNATLRVMADFATRVTPYTSFTEADIVNAVMADQTGPTARYFAELVARSIEAVATLDYMDSLAA